MAGGNALGKPIRIADASQQIIGFSLLNDWSARDVQRWEMFPLGPFLSKSFATSVSPWIVTSDALIPFRTPAMPRPEGVLAPFPICLTRSTSFGVDLTFIWRFFSPPSGCAMRKRRPSGF